MSAIEFDAQVTNDNIPIPPSLRGTLQGQVHVTVVPFPSAGSSTKIDELLARPLAIPGFVPLTRDEAHERS